MRRLRSARPLVVTALVLLIIPLSALAFKRWGPQLLINGTPSEPSGVYRLIAHASSEYRRGMYVVFPVPSRVRAFVYGRGWLKPGVPFLKELLGVAGDRICITPEALHINGAYIGPVYAQDRQGRSMPQLLGCFTVPEGAFFAASQHLKNSFDGRYFGALPLADLTGEAQPVWTF